MHPYPRPHTLPHLCFVRCILILTGTPFLTSDGFVQCILILSRTPFLTSDTAEVTAETKAACIGFVRCILTLARTPFLTSDTAEVTLRLFFFPLRPFSTASDEDDHPLSAFSPFSSPSSFTPPLRRGRSPSLGFLVLFLSILARIPFLTSDTAEVTLRLFFSLSDPSPPPPTWTITLSRLSRPFPLPPTSLLLSDEDDHPLSAFSPFSSPSSFTPPSPLSWSGFLALFLSLLLHLFRGLRRSGGFFFLSDSSPPSPTITSFSPFLALLFLSLSLLLCRLRRRRIFADADTVEVTLAPQPRSKGSFAALSPAP